MSLLALLAVIALDATACATAATCPGGTQNNNATTTITTASFSSSANVVLAATESWNCSTSITSSTVSGAGLAWTKSAQQFLTGSFANTADSGVWTANSTGALSAQTITVTRSGGGTCSGILHVYVVTGASTTIGNTGVTTSGGVSRAITVTITVSATTSFVAGAFMEGDTSATLVAGAGTTLDRTLNGTNTTGGAAGRYTGGSSGAITFGASTSSANVTAAAVELTVSGGAAGPAESGQRGFWGVRRAPPGRYWREEERC